jgi:subtilisin family serine protease
MPIGFWLVTVVSQLAIVPLVAWWLRRRAGASTSATLRITAILVGWQAAVVGLALAGAFAPRPGWPPILGLAVVAPVVLGTLALSRSGAQAPESSLAALMGLQLLRVEGFELVLAGAGGWLPQVFARPAGWGDALIGVTAPLVALAVARRTAGWRTLAVVWNLAGIADLVDAVFLGVTSSPGALRVFEGDVSAVLMTQLPLSLIPTFGVPLALLGHIVALRALWATQRGGVAQTLRQAKV